MFLGRSHGDNSFSNFKVAVVLYIDVKASLWRRRKVVSLRKQRNWSEVQDLVCVVSVVQLIHKGFYRGIVVFSHLILRRRLMLGIGPLGKD